MQISPDILNRCWFLAGPTACGKTRTALELAGHLDAEIVSLDSMALYRKMDIGTAKPTWEERNRVPHHLIDVIEPHEEYSVDEYVTAANEICEEILQRGRTPIFVGGTGLYLRSLLRGVFEGPAADLEFRAKMEKEAAESGPEKLHALLQEKDSVTGERLHPNDIRRGIRAREVLHVSGSPISQQQQQDPLPDDQRPQHVFWLNPPRDWLHGRINKRVTEMVENGLVDEVQSLMTAAQPLSRTASQALGYKEIIESLGKGEPLEQAFDCIRTRTRQFAKRQCTWFKNLVECRPIPVTGEETPSELAGRILNEGQA